MDSKSLLLLSKRGSIQWLIVALGVIGCTPAAVPVLPATITSPAESQSSLSNKKQTVIVLALDAGRYDWLDAAMQQGQMPVVAALRDQADWGRSYGVVPGGFVSSYAALATGKYPAHAGIAGERIHRAEDSFYWYTSALDVPLSAEPIWSAVRRDGKTSALMFWPGSSWCDNPFAATYVVEYGTRLAYSAQQHLTFVPSNGWQVKQDSYSPMLESQFTITFADHTVRSIYVLARDSTDNQNVDYSEILLSIDRVEDDQDAVIHLDTEDHWGSLRLNADKNIGLSLRVTDPALETFTLFRSGVYQLNACPEELFSQLQALPPFPPPADSYALEQGWIRPEDYHHMAKKQAEWRSVVAAMVYSTYTPDLTMIADPTLWQVTQPFMQSETDAAFAATLREGISWVDAEVALIQKQMEQSPASNVRMMIVGTTGLIGAHTQVNLNTFLAENEWLALDARDRVVASRSEAIAFASGGSAWVYLNVHGREKYGRVPATVFPVLRKNIAESFKNLRDPVTGELVFERVLAGDELSQAGLSGNYAGDIFIQSREGYLLSDLRGRPEVFEPALSGGRQSYSPDIAAMRGFFMLTGFEGHDLDLVRLVDIAPTLVTLLGIPLPAGMDGKPVEALIP
jgi:predicted AlkP superfamily phosphohydrolase/phosphomutase